MCPPILPKGSLVSQPVDAVQWRKMNNTVLGEMELAAIRQWLTILGIQSLAEWDILVFLRHHPFTVLDTEQVLKLSGYDSEQITTALFNLQELGLLQVLRISPTRCGYLQILPKEPRRIRAFHHLKTRVDGRSVRLALRKELHSQASPMRQSTSSYSAVAFGGSAGMLPALTEVLHLLPMDTGMAFIVIQHIAPRSILSELISYETAMPVMQIEDGMPLQPNQVFVIPPNSNLTIAKGTFCIAPRTQDEIGRHRSIDLFFTSLAEECGTSAISVILSGMSDDGVIGTAAVKKAGGVTIVQCADTAIAPDLPRNVIDDGRVDFVKTPHAIAQLLLQLSLGTA